VSANPGPGGWAFVVVKDGVVMADYHGWETFTTNNRMELQAAAEALFYLHNLHGPQNVRVWSDSAYLVDGMNQDWFTRWEKRNFLVGPAGETKRAANLDIWVRLRAEAAKHKKVAWAKVKAHSGNSFNSEADALAKNARYLGETGMMEGWAWE
jgi:ribonuclease HI